jgi:glyoxylase-like metal-dependent hydrolase (beta-lactamase superfamily II)
MPVEIRTFVTGPFATNTYLLREAEACWVIDPGFAPWELLAVLSEARLVPERVVLTHGHCDHVAGIGDLRGAVGDVPVWCPQADAEMPGDPTRNLSGPFGLPLSAPAPDELFQPGDSLTLGRSCWQVLDTSGHTPGGVSLYCPAEAVVFTGDALFAGSIGRTDIPGADARRLIDNIRRHLLTLPRETTVRPGHGPTSTIAEERRSNPFLTGQMPI